MNPTTDATKAAHFQPSDLTDFAAALLSRSDLAEDRAETVAMLLVEGDLLGHTTHGLALLPGYLQQIARAEWRLRGSRRSFPITRPRSSGTASGCPGYG